MKKLIIKLRITKKMKVTIALFNELLMGIVLVAKCLTSSLYVIRNVINPANAPKTKAITIKKIFSFAAILKYFEKFHQATNSYCYPIFMKPEATYIS